MHNNKEACRFTHAVSELNTETASVACDKKHSFPQESKAALRKELLTLRKAAALHKLGISRLREIPQFISSKVVFVYISAHGEVDTRNFLKELCREKTVVVPYCTDNDGTMICSQITSLSELRDGRFGIPEPENPVEFPKEKIDFVVVPGVAFDKDGFRLGYGKGYYDRFLKDITPFKLGVCHRDFYFESLPHDEFDVRMDSILVLQED